jgi:hypothetical protein
MATGVTSGLRGVKGTLASLVALNAMVSLAVVGGDHVSN